jgi:[protein-PII] uridylyltransferase
MIVWLVQQHLLMSRTAQRKDLTDPATIQEFAAIVGNTRYLDYLYLLTVADIAATSPQLWNNWKNGLLWDLLLQAGAALRRGLDNPLQRATAIRETRSSALSRLLKRELPAAAIRRIWDTLPEHAFLRLSADQLEWATEAVIHGEDESRKRDGAAPGMEVHIAVRGVQPHGVSELLVSVPDHDGLFASITSVLDEMGFNVLAARILTTKDGRSFDLFQLMDQQDNLINQQDAADLVERLQAATTAAEVRPLVKRAMPRRLRHFVSHPLIRFEPDPDGMGTILELECNDRPGLLSRVAAAMVKEQVQVQDARIATFGERVEDTFLVSDAQHRPLTPEAQLALADTIKQFLENG